MRRPDPMRRIAGGSRTEPSVGSRRLFRPIDPRLGIALELASLLALVDRLFGMEFGVDAARFFVEPATSNRRAGNAQRPEDQRRHSLRLTIRSAPTSRALR